MISATPDEITGSSHSTGLLYVISKITMTTATAAYNSVFSMPLNTLLLSAAFPSGPVMWEVRPFAFELVIARIELTAVAAPFQPWAPRLT